MHYVLNVCGTQLPSTVWGLGFEFRLLGLLAGAFYSLSHLCGPKVLTK